MQVIESRRSAGAGAQRTVEGWCLIILSLRLICEPADRTGLGGVWRRSRQSEHLETDGWMDEGPMEEEVLCE